MLKCQVPHCSCSKYTGMSLLFLNPSTARCGPFRRLTGFKEARPVYDREMSTLRLSPVCENSSKVMCFRSGLGPESEFSPRGCRSDCPLLGFMYCRFMLLGTLAEAFATRTKIHQADEPSRKGFDQTRLRMKDPACCTCLPQQAFPCRPLLSLAKCRLPSEQRAGQYSIPYLLITWVSKDLVHCAGADKLVPDRCQR